MLLICVSVSLFLLRRNLSIQSPHINSNNMRCPIVCVKLAVSYNLGFQYSGPSSVASLRYISHLSFVLDFALDNWYTTEIVHQRPHLRVIMCFVGRIHKWLSSMMKPYVWTTLYHISSFWLHITCIPSFSLYLLLSGYISFFSWFNPVYSSWLLFIFATTFTIWYRLRHLYAKFAVNLFGFRK